MSIPEENPPVLQQQGRTRIGCSRRTFLIGGTLAALGGGGWWLADRFSQPPADKHRILNFPLAADPSNQMFQAPQKSPEYAWLLDSTHIAYANQSELFLVNVKSGQMTWKQELSSYPSNTLLIHWSTDWARAIVVDEKETFVDDTISGGKQIVWPGSYQLSFPEVHEEEGLRVAFSPDKTLIAIANPTVSASVGIWNIQEGRRVVECQISQGYTYAAEFDMAWAPDSASLAVYAGQTNGTSSFPLPALTTWRVSDGHLLWTDQIINLGDNGSPGQIKWSSDSTTLAYICTMSFTTTQTTTLRVLDAQTGTIHFQVPLVPVQSSGNEIFVWSPDSTRLAFLVVENRRQRIQIWDVKTGQHLFTCQSVQEKPGNIAWSPDGRYLAATEVDKYTVGIGDYPASAATIQFWDAQNGKALFSYNAPVAPTSLLWSPDSRFLAVHTMTSWHCQQVGWGHSDCTATNALQVFQVS